MAARRRPRTEARWGAIGGPCCTRATLLYRGWSERRIELQQPFELGRIIASSVRTRDEHLPALIEQGVRLGDRHCDAQAHRGGDILTPASIDDKGHDGTARVLAL